MDGVAKVLLISFFSLLTACGGGEVEKECLNAEVWDGNTPAFVDASTAWGLSEIAATGTRLSAVDFDGDGWTDLAVRKDNTPDESDADGRQVWLLRNNQMGGFEDVTYESGVLAARSSSEARPGSVWAFADLDNRVHLAPGANQRCQNQSGFDMA